VPKRFAAESLLGRLQTVVDPRRREGRIYPLASTIGLLVLGALNGESSLRGMWQWGCQHWSKVSRPLGFTGQAHPPSYGTVWYLLSKLDQAELEMVLRAWLAQLSAAKAQVISVDGKYLRGSQRRSPTEAAVEVIGAVVQELKLVVGQQVVENNQELEATVELLQAVPIAGKLVTADAGLMRRKVVKTILAEGGDYLSLLKDNEPGVKDVLSEWLEVELFPSGTPPSARLSAGQQRTRSGGKTGSVAG
jgi:hypothetical protein